MIDLWLHEVVKSNPPSAERGSREKFCGCRILDRELKSLRVLRAVKGRKIL
jgi:hypothetical protein